MFGCFKKKKGPAKVIMHCAATPDDNEPGSRWYELDISEVRKWHKAKGWRDVGYHYFIKRSGEIQEGRAVGTTGAHTLGHNDAIGVCYAGMSEPTVAQLKSIRQLRDVLRRRHGISAFDWHCHNEFANKDCPGFSPEALMDILSV